MTHPTSWAGMLAFVIAWAAGARRRSAQRHESYVRANRLVVVRVQSVEGAMARRDYRAVHYAIEQVRSARIQALMLEVYR